jgi:hypothetical protein
MIVRSSFGYAFRHKIRYDTDTKRGTLTLWSSYDGLQLGTDPTVNGESLLSQYFSRFASPIFGNPFYGANRNTEFQIGDEKDVFSILASLVMVKTGRKFSFLSNEGRMISFSLGKEGKQEKEIITVKIQYGNAGKLTLDEANTLEVTTREILQKLKYSNQDISERLESIMKDS